MDTQSLTQSNISLLNNNQAGWNSFLAVLDSVDKVNEKFMFPRKTHTIILVACTKGSLELGYDMTTVKLIPCSILVLLPGHLVRKFTPSDDFEGVLISAAISNFTNMLPLMSRILVCMYYYKDNPIIQLDATEFETLVLFTNLLKHKLPKSDNHFDSLVVAKLCEGVFCETLNNYSKRIQGSINTQCSRADTLFFKFIVEVENNFKRERSVKFYADRLGVSAKHLSAVVKEISNRPPSDWIDYYVLNEIRRLLETTDLSINQISGMMGFVNQSFFGKYFKSRMNMSPLAFRNKAYSMEF